MDDEQSTTDATSRKGIEINTPMICIVKYFDDDLFRNCHNWSGTWSARPLIVLLLLLIIVMKDKKNVRRTVKSTDRKVSTSCKNDDQ